ncbi:MAG: hypothetical protein HQM06_13470 [Magnetococcales bacterium]|nr:hypothetical protein [Magnetococcales bacterium]
MKFIDPHIDFAFKKIFGSGGAKDVLFGLLKSFLGLEGDRCIAELTKIQSGRSLIALQQTGGAFPFFYLLHESFGTPAS